MDNIEDLNLLDTQYADILANSINPWYEFQAIKKGLDPAEARIKTRFITLMSHKPETEKNGRNCWMLGKKLAVIVQTEKKWMGSLKHFGENSFL